MVADLASLVRCWARHRQVQRATIFTIVSTGVVLAVVTWRVHVDRSGGGLVAHDPVLVSDLVVGHRYLLVPFALVAVLGSCVAGSVASGDSGFGLAATLAAHSRRVQRGIRYQIVAAGLSAAAWVAVVGTVVGLITVLVIATVSDGPNMTTGEAAALGSLLARLALGGGLLASVAAALGFVLPMSTIPAMVIPIGVLVAETGLQVVSGGRIALLPGGSFAVLARGDAALQGGMAPKWCGSAVPAAVVVLAALAVVAGPLLASRRGSLPS